VVIRASFAPYGRENKTKKFLTSPFPSAGGVGGAENIERKFLVLLRRYYIVFYHTIETNYTIRYTLVINMSESSKKLAANMRRIRARKEMSQGDICRALDVDRAYISTIESGKQNPTLATIEKIAQALSVSVDELLR
jgi:DNA-binding XRE family transcriptional regulator